MEEEAVVVGVAATLKPVPLRRRVHDSAPQNSPLDLVGVEQCSHYLEPLVRGDSPHDHHESLIDRSVGPVLYAAIVELSVSGT